MVSFYSYAQNVRIANLLELNNITSSGNSSAFLDASSHNTHNTTANIAKGLVFPRVDLTTFTFSPSAGVGLPSVFPTRFDGMIVYNTATSGVALQGDTEGELTAGFWFYENKTATLTGGIWKQLGSSPVVPIDDNIVRVSGDTLFVGCCDTIYFTPPNDSIFIDVKGVYPVVSEFGENDTVIVRLINNVEGVNDGDILIYNGTTEKWEAQPNALKSDEYIWLPAINLPWNLAGLEAPQVNLFKIYQQAFAPGVGTGGVPTIPNGFFEPTKYATNGNDGNYFSSTGAFRSLGRESDTPEMFDYVITYFDKSIVTILEITPQGILRYKPVAGEYPPANAFINVLMIRK